MNTNINTYAACNTAAQSESCLTGIYKDLSNKRDGYKAYLAELAVDGTIDTKSAGFASLFTGIQSFSDLLTLSRELVKSYSL